MSVAPNLKRFLMVGSLPAKSKGGPWTPASSALWVEAHRELRALLAVARAVPGLLETLHTCSVFCESCGYGNPLNGEEGTIDGQDPVERALSRLARLSSPRGIPFKKVLAKQMKDPEFTREFRKARGARRAKRRSR